MSTTEAPSITPMDEEGKRERERRVVEQAARLRGLLIDSEPEGLTPIQAREVRSLIARLSRDRHGMLAHLERVLCEHCGPVEGAHLHALLSTSAPEEPEHVEATGLLRGLGWDQIAQRAVELTGLLARARQALTDSQPATPVQAGAEPGGPAEDPPAAIARPAPRRQSAGGSGRSVQLALSLKALLHQASGDGLAPEDVRELRSLLGQASGEVRKLARHLQGLLLEHYGEAEGARLYQVLTSATPDPGEHQEAMGVLRDLRCDHLALRAVDLSVLAVKAHEALTAQTTGASAGGEQAPTSLAARVRRRLGL